MHGAPRQGLADLEQARGVGGILAAHHYHQVRALREFHRLFLPHPGGIADGVGHGQLAGYPARLAGGRQEDVALLCGLGHYVGLLQAGEGLNFLRPAYHVAAAFGVAHQAQHFGVVLVAHYNGGIAFLCVGPDVLLHVLYQRAGGVHHVGVQRADAGFLFGRNAVGADHQDGVLVLYLLHGAHGADVLFFEGLDDLLVVDKRAEGVDGLVAVLGELQHFVYGVLHAGAKAGAFGHRDLYFLRHDKAILSFSNW